MSTDKKPTLTELSEDELLLIAQNKIELPKEAKGLNEAHRFILDLNIKLGDTKVPSGIIYERYKQWKEQTKGKIQAKNLFTKDFAQFFPNYRSTHYRYYLLDATPFDLSEESYKAYETAKKEDQKENRKNQERYRKITEQYLKKDPKKV